jgi:DNA-binding transcriptional ArsR family regulator
MTKGFIALIAFAITLLIVTTPAFASQTAPGERSTLTANDLETKVLQDSQGNVHVLWIVPALNDSVAGPGIWYSKYTPNGTDTIPLTRITNSTTIQSGDLAVDAKGNAIIAWADDIIPTGATYSVLYLLHFNSTAGARSQVLSKKGTLILWPSLAPATNGTIYITWTEYDPSSFHARLECGTLAQAGLTDVKAIATYDRADAFPPQSKIVYDNATRRLQIAWGESEGSGAGDSTVNYAKLESNKTLVKKIQVARFTPTLRQVTITPMIGTDGAFVLWQTAESHYSLYVSQISANGNLVYVKELNYTGQSRYLAVSSDHQDNLYVVWYQPSLVTPTYNLTTSVASTNVAYLRMNLDGDIVQSGSGVFHAPIIGVTVLNDSVYGVSPDGLVTVVTPTTPSSDLSLTAMALMSCISVAGFAGSVLIEEGRYRWVAVYSRISKSSTRAPVEPNQSVVRLLARKPGLNVRDIKRLTQNDPVGIASLRAMEKSGTLASFRQGLSRRFYVKGTDIGQIDALRTRILLWISDHPGIWEAQMAKDLGLSQQIVHYHLKKLREAQLVLAGLDKNGSRKLYRLAGERREPD